MGALPVKTTTAKPRSGRTTTRGQGHTAGHVPGYGRLTLGHDNTNASARDRLVTFVKELPFASLPTLEAESYKQAIMPAIQQFEAKGYKVVGFDDAISFNSMLSMADRTPGLPSFPPNWFWVVMEKKEGGQTRSVILSGTENAHSFPQIVRIGEFIKRSDLEVLNERLIGRHLAYESVFRSITFGTRSSFKKEPTLDVNFTSVEEALTGLRKLDSKPEVKFTSFKELGFKEPSAVENRVAGFIGGLSRTMTHVSHMQGKAYGTTIVAAVDQFKKDGFATTHFNPITNSAAPEQSQFSMVLDKKGARKDRTVILTGTGAYSALQTIRIRKPVDAETAEAIAKLALQRHRMRDAAEAAAGPPGLKEDLPYFHVDFLFEDAKHALHELEHGKEGIDVLRKMISHPRKKPKYSDAIDSLPFTGKLAYAEASEPLPVTVAQMRGWSA